MSMNAPTSSAAPSTFGSIPTAGIVTEQAIARVRNVGDETFRARYNNVWYEVHPEMEALVPWFAVCLWFGDPRSKNVGTKRSTMYRQKEIERISAKYGVYGDPWESPVPRITSMVDPFNGRREISEGDPYEEKAPSLFRHPNLPEIEVFDVTTGQRIYTVLDDPQGLNGAPKVETSADQLVLLEQTVKSLQAQLQTVSMELGRQAPERAANLLGVEAAADLPLLPDASTDDDIDNPGFDGVAQTDETTVTPPESPKKSRGKKSNPDPTPIATDEDGIE
jgi:hypothetical protein